MLTGTQVANLLGASVAVSCLAGLTIAVVTGRRRRTPVAFRPVRARRWRRSRTAWGAAHGPTSRPLPLAARRWTR